MTEVQATEKADRKTLWAVKSNFFARFKDFLSSYLHLKDNEIYQEIDGRSWKKMEKDVDINKALNQVMPRYKAKFVGLFEQDEDSDDEEESVEEDAHHDWITFKLLIL